MAKYGHDNPPPGYAACTRAKGHKGPCALPFWSKAERRAFLLGMEAAAEWIAPWDKQLAPAVDGYKFSDILLCKFNLTRRKNPRKLLDVEPDLTDDQIRRVENIIDRFSQAAQAMLSEAGNLHAIIKKKIQ